ncbi:glycosyltransferase family 39 protein [Paracoccus cavernae]|uniref:Glycosyltransferase family 39 protein n=1 Tax=Paracoccus cavernae TaxID=1571207 RepID=A0ABT8D8F8_9RHOB|nr:glycosyltransferase family 39 protein [Paracoccus cavernae]
MRLSVLSATLLFALGLLVLVLLRPLMPIDETRYVAAAWEMHQGGSLFVPHLNGELYGHKPPLLFWLINLVWLFTGPSGLAARLVAPAFAVGGVALTGLLARRLWPGEPERAGIAALILACSPVFLFFGSTTMFDTILAVSTLLAMLALWQAAQEPDLAGGTASGRRSWLLLGAAIALGVYGKGPVIFLHVLPVALTMPLWAPAPRAPVSKWFRGLALALGVAIVLVALWLLPALVIGGEPYQIEVLWRQSAGRMASSFAHQRPVWFYLALLPMLIWPFGWTRSGLGALAPRALAARPETRFLTIWFLGALIAFSAISGKQTHYLLPEIPALALLLARGPAQRQWTSRDLWLALPLAGLALGLVAAGLRLVPALEALDFRQPLWAAALGLLCLGAGIWGFLRLRSGLIGLGALALSFVIALHLAASPLLFARYDLTPLGAALAPYRDAGIAITDGTYHAQLNFAARLDHPVARPTTPEAVADWAASHPGGVLLDLSGAQIAGLHPVARLPYRSDTYTLFQPNEVTP